MSKSTITTSLGTLLSLLFAGATTKYPQFAPVLMPLATLLFGWLHLPQPGTVKVADLVVPASVEPKPPAL